MNRLQIDLIFERKKIMIKKTLYSFVALCLVNTIHIQAQNYIPMLNDSLYWDVAYGVNDPNPCAIFGVNGPVRYKIGADTTINGTIYKQMNGYPFHLWSPGCTSFYVDTISQPLSIYLREDTVSKQVYSFDTFSQLERLLFDFSLQQHDSIFLPGPNNNYFYVDTLYTITTIDGISRKYFECFPRPNQGTTGGFYIEGLGGAMGPFERPYNLFEEGYWLLCISDIHQSPVYGFTWNCFNFVTGLSFHDETGKILNVFPIPASERIFVEGFPLNSYVTIVTPLGEIVHNKNILSEPSIDISNFKSGIYYMIIESESKFSRATFVKQ